MDDTVLQSFLEDEYVYFLKSGVSELDLSAISEYVTQCIQVWSFVIIDSDT